MSKRIIERALRKAIEANNQHEVSLHGGEELAFTTSMSDYITACYDEVGIPNHGGNERVDLVKYSNSSRRQINWALEAKHFTPHQKEKLNRFNPKGYLGYLEYSLSGPVEDALKLVDCGFGKFYILQLQTHITDFDLFTYTYPQLVAKYPIFRKYLHKTNEVSARANINLITVQNRIIELEQYSRQLLDANLICGHIPRTIRTVEAKVDVTIHYLINGPFKYKELYPRLIDTTNPFPLDPTIPFEKQVGLGNPISAWDIDVSIASDTEE